MSSQIQQQGSRLALSPQLEAGVINSVFRQHRRVHIAGVLEEQGAVDLFRCLQKEVPWRLSCHAGGRNANFSEEDLRKLTDVDRVRLDQHFLETAQRGFEYVFGNWPIYDLWKAGREQPALMVETIEFLNSPSFLDFAREATGIREIAYADAQATRYGPGHFLTSHDDSVDKQGRLAAFVLNLTPKWMPDWGGILQFFDEEGHVEEGYAPTFNALNVFRVPKLHAVSYVTPFTASYRYSVSGWFWAQ